MSELNWSNEAELAKAAMFECQYMVYVESKNDIHYWKQFFDGHNVTFKYQYTNGIPGMREHIEDIINENKPVFVAVDRDLEPHHQIHPKHPRIVKTYGYSIENDLCCPQRFNTHYQVVSRSLLDVRNEYHEWRTAFSRTFRMLLACFIFHVKQEMPKMIPSSSADYFKARKVEFDIDKVNKHVSQYSCNVPDEELYKIACDIDNDPRDVFMQMRGHFLEKGFAKLLKNLAKGSNVTWEGFYRSMVIHCPHCHNRHKCIIFENLSSQVGLAIKSLS